MPGTTSFPENVPGPSSMNYCCFKLETNNFGNETANSRKSSGNNDQQVALSLANFYIVDCVQGQSSNVHWPSRTSQNYSGFLRSTGLLRGIGLAAIWINHAKMTEANDALNSGEGCYVVRGYMQVF